MISSVIPARLQFQCGHAAMVTLPRIKGESATQRNDRAAREKSAALARQCDFCAPAVVVAVNGNGNSHVADLVEPAASLPETSVSERTLLETVVPETVVAELTVAEAFAPETSLPETSADVDAAGAEELAAAAAEVLETDVAPEIVAVELAAAPEPENLNGIATAPAPVVRRARRPVAPRKARAEEIARGRRFLVEYRVERVLHAVDIHDALRQAASFGASQVTAITREDS